MENLAVAFSGPSNSGKTTLIVKIAEILKQNYELAIIKHDPGDKARFDKEGKDSWKFSKTGAEVVVASATRTTLFSKRQRDIDELISLLGDFDFLLVEGLKTLPLPRISVFRNELDESYFDVSDALAIDESINLNNYTLPKHLEILSLNEPEAIIEWIKKHAKKVR